MRKEDLSIDTTFDPYTFNVGFENNIDGAIHDPNLVPLTLSRIF